MLYQDNPGLPSLESPGRNRLGLPGLGAVRDRIGSWRALLDRLDHMGSYSAMYGNWKGDLTPAEVLQRNFWFCAVEDPSAFVQRDRIGVDHILVESDYPHCDSTWPNTQAAGRSPRWKRIRSMMWVPQSGRLGQ